MNFTKAIQDGLVAKMWTIDQLIEQTGLTSAEWEQIRRGSFMDIHMLKKICVALELVPAVFVAKAVEERDVQDHKKEFYAKLKPVLDALVEIIEGREQKTPAVTGEK